ncbi:2-hydroxychromene-2-carboxylate isomerase [Bosea sp. (in: a-proteobacteria)]|uniref:2-hydroxychromene-2-carboxylate isomerase n=1 Tax=Bosea sp. (in: a-proteobacteria) TaxID=1871050 RepID=UPI0025C6B613|nr:2-hydroxychromene-2-carboxylate isomerase [Bosea sp. (in: a-proteobacteria)]MBR3193915.1 2-hydroxychromene-2-carboxylate isomerase [Bosea sp. (in: a-proteobacteria)]
MTQPALWYFDIISPFAHLALTRLGAIREHRPVLLKPLVFGGVLKAWGQLGPAEIAPKRVHTYRLATHLAQAMGVPFRFPPAHPFNPLAMLRLLTALDGNDAAVTAAFHLVWGEGRDANDPQILQEVADAAGRPDALALIGEQEVKDRLRQTTEEAVAAGVFGVPSLVIDGEIFWGVDAMPMAVDYLADPATFRSGEMARVSALPEGIQRQR